MRIKVSFSEAQGFYASFGDLKQSLSVSFGEVQHVQTLYAEYTGEYTVTPKANETQTLATRNTVMTDNITVYEIPYVEVSNEKGGYTATIGD